MARALAPGYWARWLKVKQALRTAKQGKLNGWVRGLSLSMIVSVATLLGQAAQAQLSPGLGPIGAQMFFDARQTSFSRDLKRQEFEGDVVAIGAATLIAADKISLDRQTNVMTASGHLVVMSTGQVFTGSKLEYNTNSSDFAIYDAMMVANDKQRSADVTERILGFSGREVQFEKARSDRIKRIDEELVELRKEARRAVGQGEPLPPEVVNRYAILLEQKDLVREQPNPALARLDESRAERYERRRKFWNNVRKPKIPQQRSALAKAYFSLEGDVIRRTEGNDFIAENALWTPCRCEEDESPAWGFWADRVEAQVGGYADLYHPVLKIKGIPVLYLPYLKVPIKDQRQSGFLMPTFAFEKRSGNIFSQPVFFDFGPDRDATITAEVFENRGTKLGLEYRLQQRRFNGWEFYMEAIRDRLWMEDRGRRQVMRDLYLSSLSNLDVATPDGQQQVWQPGLSDRENYRLILADPDFWTSQGVRYRRRNFTTNNPDGTTTTEQRLVLDEDSRDAVQRSIDTFLAVPPNSWRGAYGWRGVTHFAPRLSIASAADITTDHRYSEELYVPDDFDEAFFGGRDAKAFGTARARVHLDAKQFYAGLGSRLGDNFRLDEQFEGQQMPLRFKAQSRMFSLLPAASPIPLYGQVQGEQIRISEFENTTSADSGELNLGNGNWRRIAVDTLSPLMSGQVVQVSHFFQGEGRYIDHSGLSESNSEIRSWRTGFEFNLPIDGKGELPDFFQDEEANSKKFVHHFMDWTVRLSARPSVVKRGPYVGDDPDEGRLAYFASDRYTGEDWDQTVPEENRMRKHRRVSFVTNHRWRLFRRGWKVVPGQKRPGEAEADSAPESEEQAKPDSAERARQELLFSLDRQVRSDEEMFDEDGSSWFINRYRLVDNYYDSPVSLRAGISYDFLDGDERPLQRERNQDAQAEINQLDAAINLEEAKDEAEQDLDLLASLRTQRSQAAKRIEKLVKPWKDPFAEVSVRYGGWRFGLNLRWDIYARTSSYVRGTIGLPSFFRSNLTLSYETDKTIDPTFGSFSKTSVSGANLATSVIPGITAYTRASRKIYETRSPDYTQNMKIAYGFQYKSTSDCWGLRFSREKDFNKDERNAKYVLQLEVIFMGQRRPLPDMSASAVRELGDREPAN